MGITRRRALVVGLFICLPVILLGTFPASAWRLVAEQWSKQLATGDSTRRDYDSGSQVAFTSPIRITGTMRRVLSPGASVRIDLQFANPNAHSVAIHNIKVRVTEVVAPRADAAHPCSPADFHLRQMRPGRTLRLPADQTTTLADLGVQFPNRPRLAMLARPVNQDGCKGAQLTLRYRATGVRIQ